MKRTVSRLTAYSTPGFRIFVTFGQLKLSKNNCPKCESGAPDCWEIFRLKTGQIRGDSWQGKESTWEEGVGVWQQWQEWQQLTTSLVHICGFVCRKSERAAEQEHLAKWLNGPKVKGERLKGGRWPGRNMLRIIIAKLQIAQRKCRGTAAGPLSSINALRIDPKCGKFPGHLPNSRIPRSTYGLKQRQSV